METCTKHSVLLPSPHTPNLSFLSSSFALSHDSGQPSTHCLVLRQCLGVSSRLVSNSRSSFCPLPVVGFQVRVTVWSPPSPWRDPLLSRLHFQLLPCCTLPPASYFVGKISKLFCNPKYIFGMLSLFVRSHLSLSAVLQQAWIGTHPTTV